MAGYGLTDLERGKYLPGGSNVSSTVRVQPTAESVVPVERYRYEVRYAENAGSKDQLVNGSVTPVDFVINFPNRTLLDHLDFSVVAINTTSILNYGTISGGLTNGIQLLTKRGGTEVLFFTIKSFMDLNHVSTVAVTAKKISGNVNEEVFNSSLQFIDPAIFEAGDQIIIRIRDNLTAAGLTYQRMSVIMKEV